MEYLRVHHEFAGAAEDEKVRLPNGRSLYVRLQEPFHISASGLLQAV